MIILCVWHYLKQVLCHLQETHNPNWIARLCFLSNIEKKGEDRVNYACMYSQGAHKDMLLLIGVRAHTYIYTCTRTYIHSRIHTCTHTYLFSSPLEAVLSVSVDKVAKHWLLPSRSEMKEVGSIFEEKSQTLGLTSPPLSLTSYSYQNTHSTVLVVCKEAWQVGTTLDVWSPRENIF